MSSLSFEDFDKAIEAFDDLIGILQDLKHRIETVDDLDEYGFIESLITFIDQTLERYNALD